MLFIRHEACLALFLSWQQMLVKQFCRYISNRDEWWWQVIVWSNLPCGFSSSYRPFEIPWMCVSVCMFPIWTLLERSLYWKKGAFEQVLFLHPSSCASAELRSFAITDGWKTISFQMGSVDNQAVKRLIGLQLFRFSQDWKIWDAQWLFTLFLLSLLASAADFILAVLCWCLFLNKMGITFCSCQLVVWDSFSYIDVLHVLLVVHNFI